MKTHTIALLCAAAFAGVAVADEEESSGWAYNPGEGVSFNEHPIVSAEFSIARTVRARIGMMPVSS